MMRQRPACGAWCYLEDEFLGQKESRTLLLETQFRNLRQDSMTITEFCRCLETMAASLAEFGDPIGDRQMVLTLLRGLSGKFRHMVSILKMHHPFLTFTEAWTHLSLEEMEIDARPPSPPAALVAHQQPTASGPPAPSSTSRQGNPSAPQQRPHCVPTGGQRTHGRRRGRGGRGGGQQPPGGGTPSAGQGSAPPGMHQGMHPSFAQPWAGLLQMWPYGRPPPQPAFTVFPQYGGSFGSVPGGGVYGTGYTAPPPYAYGGAVHLPSTLQGPSAPYQTAAQAPWNPTHGGAWNQDSLVQSFNTMSLTPPAPSEWYADSGAGSHMTADTGKLSTILSPSSLTPSSIIVGNGALLPVTATGSHTFSFPHRNLVLNDVLVSPNIIKNLISIRRFTTDNNCSIEFDPFGLSVKDLQIRNVIARCNSSGDLYPFYPPAISTSALLAAPTSI
jgi:hypothetical protein